MLRDLPQRLRHLLTRTPEWKSGEERERLADLCSRDPALGPLAAALHAKSCSALRKVWGHPAIPRFVVGSGFVSSLFTSVVILRQSWRCDDADNVLVWHLKPATLPRRAICCSWCVLGDTSPTCGCRAAAEGRPRLRCWQCSSSHRRNSSTRLSLWARQLGQSRGSLSR